MAVKISDLGQAVLPLTGAELIEVTQGTPAESRRIAVTDLVSGAIGLDASFVTVAANLALPNERILTGGTNVSIVDSGPGLPITIIVPIPNQNPFVTPLGILGDINTATPPVAEAITDLLEFRDAQDVNLIGSIGYNAVNEFLLQNEMRGGGIRIRGRETSSGALTTFFQGVPDSFTFIGSPGALAGDGKTMFLTTGDGQGGFEGGDMILEAGRGGGSGLPGRIQIEQGNLFIAEHPAAIIDNPGYGQFWVRDDVPNTPMFTDDVGTDFELNASGAVLDQFNFQFNDSTAATDPGSGFIAFNNATPSLVTLVVISETDADGVDISTDVMDRIIDAWEIRFTDPDDLTVDVVFTVTNIVDSGTFRTITVAHQRGATIPVNNTPVIVKLSDQPYIEIGVPSDGEIYTMDATTEHLQPSSCIARDGGGSVGIMGTSLSVLELAQGGGGVRTSLSLSAAFTDNNNLLILFSNGGDKTIQTNVNGGPLFLQGGNGNHPVRMMTTCAFNERAAALADVLSVGQVWVRNDAPNTLMFTDDVGTDFVVGGALGSFLQASDNAIITGAWTFTNTGGLDLDPSCELSLRNNADSSEVFLQNLGPTFQFGIAGADFGSGVFEISQSSFAHVLAPPIFIGEQAAAESLIAGDGQVWVRNDVPNTLMFSDDAGTDFVVAGTLAVAVDSFEGRTGVVVATVGDYADVAETYVVLETFTADIAISQAIPRLRMQETGLGADLGNWLFRANGGDISLATATDAAPSVPVVTAMSFIRGATTAVASVDFAIDVQIITGNALTIFDAADVDSVSMEINTTTLAPAEAFVFIASANIAAYNFDEEINIDNGGIHIGGLSDGLEFWRVGDSVSHSIVRETDGIHIQVVAGVLRVQADSLMMHEVANPGTNVAGRGQWWVRSSAPARPTFTDDTDVDQLLDPSISDIVSVIASRTLVLTDKGKTIGFTGGTAAQTMTIPANASVAYQIGTFVAFDNTGSVSISIAITTDTLRFADDNTTGTRTLAAGGYAVAQKVAATEWKIAGAGIT